VTAGEVTVAFRRHTDYVVCERCLVSHPVEYFRRDDASIAG
jgi:hypothetical protein